MHVEANADVDMDVDMGLEMVGGYLELFWIPLMLCVDLNDQCGKTKPASSIQVRKEDQPIFSTQSGIKA